MKAIIKDCKKCWVVSGVLAVLIFCNAFQLVNQGHNHHFSMPVFLKVLNFML